MATIAIALTSNHPIQPSKSEKAEGATTIPIIITLRISADRSVTVEAVAASNECWGALWVFLVTDAHGGVQFF